MNNRTFGYIYPVDCTHSRNYQRTSLIDAGCEIIYEEKSMFQSIELNKCINELRNGDKLIVLRVNKLFSNRKMMLDWLIELTKRNITIISVADALTLSSEKNGSALRLCLALKKLHEQRKKKHKLKTCRPCRLTEQQTTFIYQSLQRKEASITELAQRYQVSRTTLYTALKRFKVEGCK